MSKSKPKQERKKPAVVVIKSYRDFESISQMAKTPKTPPSADLLKQLARIEKAIAHLQVSAATSERRLDRIGAPRYRRIR